MRRSIFLMMDLWAMSRNCNILDGLSVEKDRVRGGEQPGSKDIEGGDARVTWDMTEGCDSRAISIRHRHTAASCDVRCVAHEFLRRRSENNHGLRGQGPLRTRSAGLQVQRTRIPGRNLNGSPQVEVIMLSSILEMEERRT